MARSPLISNTDNGHAFQPPRCKVHKYVIILSFRFEVLGVGWCVGVSVRVRVQFSHRTQSVEIASQMGARALALSKCDRLECDGAQRCENIEREEKFKKHGTPTKKTSSFTTWKCWECVFVCVWFFFAVPTRFTIGRGLW